MIVMIIELLLLHYLSFLSLLCVSCLAIYGSLSLSLSMILTLSCWGLLGTYVRMYVLTYVYTIYAWKRCIAVHWM